MNELINELIVAKLNTFLLVNGAFMNARLKGTL